MPTNSVALLFRFKDGQAIGESNVMALQDLTVDDSGIYTCTATSKKSIAHSDESHLTIAGTCLKVTLSFPMN